MRQKFILFSLSTAEAVDLGDNKRDVIIEKYVGLSTAEAVDLGD